MRRHDREITDRGEQLAILRQAEVCRIALNDEDGYPYIIPINFGVEEREGRVLLHFHSALEGHKLELMRRDSRAAFEVDVNHQIQYFPEKGYCTAAYESVTGRGRFRILTEEQEIKDSLACLMDHYHPGENAYYNPAAIPRTTVYVLEVESMTGKRKQPK